MEFESSGQVPCMVIKELIKKDTYLEAEYVCSILKQEKNTLDCKGKQADCIYKENTTQMEAFCENTYSSINKNGCDQENK